MSLRRLPIGNQTDHVTPHMIFRRAYQHLWKILFVRKNRLFQQYRPEAAFSACSDLVEIGCKADAAGGRSKRR